MAESFLSSQEQDTELTPGLILPEDFFLDQGRRYHPEISDDNLKMIYRLGEDEWSGFGYEEKCSDSRNIFQILACFACDMLEYDGDWPIVHFKDLFRWRDTTQILGEDLLCCAFLAYRDKEYLENTDRKFCWPSVLHNDNPQLTYLFKTKRLCELHSHLQASANVFEITWVSLMNFISGTQSKFEELAKIHIPSRYKEVGESLFRYVVEAACLRWTIYEWLKREVQHGNAITDLCNGGDEVFLQSRDYFASKSLEDKAAAVDSLVDAEKMGLAGAGDGNSFPDYIWVEDTPMAVYAGERWLLYNTLKRIFSINSSRITLALYRYILCKSLLRSYFVQINNNIGFANFQRFQSVKSKLLSSGYGYKKLLKSLPLWEARKHNYVKFFETRIAPAETKFELDNDKKTISSLIKDDRQEMSQDSDKSQMEDWSLIFHFIKRKSKEGLACRDAKLRENVESASKKLSLVAKDPNVSAVDAASSELAVRPEVFSQAFRYLRHYGYKATFHAGEDFYDIADGLRAIDESINLLKLKSSDRLGHALALGIDAEQYYEARHNYIALPIQWMLDNVVWILIRSKDFGITVPPQIERFLDKTYKSLCTKIGYADIHAEINVGLHKKVIPDIIDYWDSMALRGDSPEVYNADGTIEYNDGSKPGDWEYYSLLDSEYAKNVRLHNYEAKKLYYKYHHQVVEGDCIKERGMKVKSFRLPDGYPKLITALQEGMIKEVSKRQLCIECCPSSNVKIGKLSRFDSHPIFRFLPLDQTKTRYPLAVTVNTDDLGVFATSLPNEFSLLALALLKMKDKEGNHIYSTQEVYDWIGRVIDNGHKFTFLNNEERNRQYAKPVPDYHKSENENCQ